MCMCIYVYMCMCVCMYVCESLPIGETDLHYYNKTERRDKQ